MKPFFLLLSFLAGALLPQGDVPPSPLALKEAIEVMADYNVEHVRMPSVTPYYGLTDPDSRTIYVVESMDLRLRREVTLHEVIHATLRLRGDERWGDEETVHAMTSREYHRLFGQT